MSCSRCQCTESALEVDKWGPFSSRCLILRLWERRRRLMFGLAEGTCFWRNRCQTPSSALKRGYTCKAELQTFCTSLLFADSRSFPGKSLNIMFTPVFSCTLCGHLPSASPKLTRLRYFRRVSRGKNVFFVPVVPCHQRVRTRWNAHPSGGPDRFLQAACRCECLATAWRRALERPGGTGGYSCSSATLLAHASWWSD